MSDDELPDSPIFSDNVGGDLGAMFAIFFGAMIAAGGGLGGGGVFVPIYILILQYPPKYAAALSQATIFGGSIVNLIMNLKKYHPTRSHRPLTDFSTLLILEPMLLVGTIIGRYCTLHHISSECEDMELYLTICTCFSFMVYNCNSIY